MSPRLILQTSTCPRHPRARPPCSSAFAGFVCDADRDRCYYSRSCGTIDLPRKGVFSTDLVIRPCPCFANPSKQKLCGVCDGVSSLIHPTHATNRVR